MVQQGLGELQLLAVVADARLELERVFLNQFECFLAGSWIAGTELHGGKVRHAAYQLGIQKTSFLRQRLIRLGLELRKRSCPVRKDRCLDRETTKWQKQSKSQDSHCSPAVRQDSKELIPLLHGDGFASQ